MKKYLVDTNILIDFLKGNLDFKVLSSIRNQAILSFITVGELLQGIENKQDRKKLNNFLASFEIAFLNNSEQKLALSLLEKHQLKYQPGLLDCCVAAQAYLNDYILLTNNVKHFKFIKELSLVKPDNLK